MKMFIIKLFVLILYVGMIYMNYYANAKPLGGISTGEISDKYNTLFTPSGFTFSIWGIIYILVGIFVFQVVINNLYITPKIDIVIYLFMISTILNVSWLFSWHYDRILLSAIIMILFLIVLLTILNRIQPSNTLSYITFSIYSGWISVALIANISILITKYNISFFMNNQWFFFILILLVSLGIMISMFIKTSNYYYCGVYLWAYFGILMKFIK